MSEETFLPTETRIIEDSFTYLSATHPRDEALALLHFSIELQKINLQARLIAKPEVDLERLIERTADEVFRRMDERNQDKDESP